MKKKSLIALVVVLVMCFSLTACGGGASGGAPESAPAEKQAEANAGDYEAYTFEGTAVDPITVEKVVLMPERHSDGEPYLKWKMLVRNTSGADLMMDETSMRVWYRYLDADEVELYSSYDDAGYSNTIQNEKAAWIEVNGYPSGWDAVDRTSVAYIEIYGYTTDLAGEPNGEFSEYVTVNVNEAFSWDDIVAE